MKIIVNSFELLYNLNNNYLNYFKQLHFNNNKITIYKKILLSFPLSINGLKF